MRIPFLLFCIMLCFNLYSQFTEILHPYEDNEISWVDEIISVDLNGDDYLDFVISYHSGNMVHVGINDAFQKPTFIPLSEGRHIRKLAAHDFDQDGDMDLFGSQSFGNNDTYVWKNDGTGNFTEEILDLGRYESIYFIDILGDEAEEMIMGVGNQLNIYDITNGQVSLLKTLIDDSFAGAPNVIDVVDYNGDGLMDIAACFFSGIKIFQKSSEEDFTQIDIAPTVFADVSMRAADVNNDQIIDFLLYRNIFTTLLSSSSPGEYIDSTLPSVDGQNYFSYFEDIDLDGDLDIFYIEEEDTNDGTTSILYNNEGVFEKEIITKEYSRTYFGGVSDLDNDGDNDLYMFTNDVFDFGLVIFRNNTIVDSDNDGYNSDEDCDDDNPNINPGQDEVVYNGLDDDCDPETLDDDLDEDGFVLIDDCNDDDPDINPNAVEIANNGIDEDCDGMDLMTSTFEIENVRINIFPNPVSDKLQIEILGSLDYEIKIYNDLGSVIESIQDNRNSIDVSNLPTGVYLLEISVTNSPSRIVERISIVR